MNARTRLAAAAATACIALVGPVVVGPVLAQQPSPSATPPPSQSPEDALPAGPGKDVVLRVCTACHDASQFAFARYTPAEWDTEIAKMQSAGAEMTAEEQATISAYMAKNLNSNPEPVPAPAPDAKPPPG